MTPESEIISLKARMGTVESRLSTQAGVLTMAINSQAVIESDLVNCNSRLDQYLSRINDLGIRLNMEPLGSINNGVFNKFVTVVPSLGTVCEVLHTSAFNVTGGVLSMSTQGSEMFFDIYVDATFVLAFSVLSGSHYGVWTHGSPVAVPVGSHYIIRGSSIGSTVYNVMTSIRVTV